MARSKKKTGDTLAFNNAAKTLLANIRFASVDTPIKSITVTSSIPNEGKSTIALNLAQAIATSGKSVLLVECDMRHRTLANLLGLRHSGGLYAVLSDQMSVDEAVVETGQPNFFFLDAEPRIPNPADIIASRRFAKLVAALEEKYQYVIFDTPPVGTFVDAAEVAAITDGTIYRRPSGLCQAQRDPRCLRSAQQGEKVNVIGTVMNCCDTSSHDYYYSYYGGDKAQNNAAAGVNPAVGGAAATGTPAKAKRFKK